MVSYDLGNIGSGNDLSPVRPLVITWTISDSLPTEPLRRNLNEILINKCI